jgi:hypothetical protein
MFYDHPRWSLVEAIFQSLVMQPYGLQHGRFIAVADSTLLLFKLVVPEIKVIKLLPAGDPAVYCCWCQPSNLQFWIPPWVFTSFSVYFICDRCRGKGILVIFVGRIVFSLAF